jgi:hypothetical protein
LSSLIISGNTSGTITLDAPAVAGTTTLTLPTTSGTITTKDTNGILSVNGIQFPATQSASADANCLDDYEEGTWTPSMTSTGATITLGNAQGYYTKIGNMVFAAAYTSVASVTGTTTNPVVLSGLPFTTKSQGNDGASCVFGVQTFTTPGTAFVVPGNTQFNIYQQGTVTAMKANQLNASFYLYTVIYQTA